MLGKAIALWVVGLLTIVPYGTWYLLFHATRDQYALNIVIVLFWIFGYWGVVGPLLSALKVRSVMRAMERAQSSAELEAALRSGETREVVIDLIASENHIPRFLAARVYKLFADRLARAQDAGPAQ
ncbi:MAG TPA: hypothetical protein VFO79_06970 [Xanthomonadales bacterium]|nr:hypothetical protein [Xanthomonadales bacterium]